MKRYHTEVGIRGTNPTIACFRVLLIRPHVFWTRLYYYYYYCYYYYYYYHYYYYYYYYYHYYYYYTQNIAVSCSCLFCKSGHQRSKVSQGLIESKVVKVCCQRSHRVLHSDTYNDAFFKHPSTGLKILAVPSKAFFVHVLHSSQSQLL